MSLFDKVKSHYEEALESSSKPPRKLTGTEKKTVRVLLLILLLIIAVGGYFGYKSYQDDQKVADSLGCESFEDCLSKYKFEGAYHYYNEIDGKVNPDDKYFNFKKLISAQVNYWCGEKDFEKAFTILNEHTMMATYNLQTDDETANDEYNEEAGFMNSQLEFIIGQMLVSGEEKGTILKYAKSLKPIVIGNEDDTSMFGGYNSYVLSNQPYDDAIEKIKKN